MGIFQKLHGKVPRAHRAQGLAEYALILVLVSIVVIAILALVGLGLHRAYGLVAGSLGGKQDASGSIAIRIEQSLCIAKLDTNQTGMYITGFITPGVPLTDFEVHTTKTADTAFDADSDGIIDTMDLNQIPLAEYGGPGGFKWNPMIKSNLASTGLCPTAIMIRLRGNASVFAVSPVKIELR
jgi:Flp pilus assembly pilin Flp